jgi:peptidoglycan/LPS O-acetylase OafA/YrhL
LLYRNDIDGLRALAVLLILFFHADLANVPGGFIGVDVFFVISGFLITTLIQKEHSQGHFSFYGFYLRRLRRLAPALLFVLALTLIFGWYLQPPKSYQLTAQSAIAAVFSFSNVNFWWHSGYFDSSAISKPLLHTWSLGVEEQFYLIWPPVLIVMLQRFSRPCLIGSVTLIALISLLASQLLLQSHQSAAFFLTPFRLYEFSLGVLLATTGLRARGALSSNIAAMTGIFSIIYVAGQFDGAMNFPGLNALVPTIGAALLIYAGPNNGISQALSLPPIRYIGRISYSLYLVHWPIQVYYQLMFGRPETSSEILTLLLVSCICGAAMYHAIETPFRKKVHDVFWISPKALIGISAVFACIVVTASLSIYLKRGVQTRFSQDSIAYVRALDQAIEQRHQNVRDWTCNATTGSIDTYFDDFSTCLPSELDRLIVVLGDSHAADIYMGLRAGYPDKSIVQLTGNGCHLGKDLRANDFCTPFFAFWKTWLNDHGSNIDAVIYGQTGAAMVASNGGYNRADTQVLTRLVENLNDFVPNDVPLFIWGPRPRFNPTIDIAIIRSETPLDLRTYYPASQFSTERNLDTWLDAHLGDTQFHYRSSIATLCTDYCPTLTYDGSLFVTDYAHWSLAGAAQATKMMIASDPLLTEILAPR